MIDGAEALAGTQSTPVLIVGAGPTGLMAAGLLARCGIACRILDKSPGPAKESRAMVMQSKSMELFLAMGLAETVLDRGLIQTGAQLVVDGRSAARVDFEDIGRFDTPYPFPVMIPQSDTEAVLAADLARRGVAIEYGAEVTRLTQDDAGVSVTVHHRDGRDETVHAGYAIGADGAHSLVRKALGLTFEGAAYTQQFLLADCRVQWPFDRAELIIFLHGTELAAYFPMRGSDHGRVLVVAPGMGDRQAGIETQGSSDIAITEIETALRRIAGVDVRLSEPTWTSRYRVHHRGVDRYRDGRVFVAGDAAHIHSPAGGQGMNTGLQDAANLAWKLAAVIQGGAPAALLDSYHSERWPIGRKILERTDRMFAGMSTTNPLIAALRNLALPLVAGTAMRSDTMRAKALHFISELGIRYHAGTFVEDDLSLEAPTGWHRGFRAGSRAPDGRISRALSCFDLLKADCFTLLALAFVPLGEEPIARLSEALGRLPPGLAGLPCETHLIARSTMGRDPRFIQAESPDIFKSYGLGAAAPYGLFLIRPDGYIAYRSDRLDVDRLAAFMQRFGPA